MKILMIDKYFFIKGGAERYFFELKKLLESNGHEVIPFSMAHPDNFESPYSDYFVDNIEFNGLSAFQKATQAPKILGRIVYSQEAKKALARLIDATRPDIAHLHMIDHQLSPSILHVLRDYGIPVIQTCHQYKLVCPSYRLFVMHKNEICEKCVTGNFYHPLIERCHKNSLAASALVAFESYVHKWLKIHDIIDLFHVPSQFLGGKLVEGGVKKERIWSQFYTINLDDYPYHPQASDYFIYYGRLSEEKGVMTLLESIAPLPDMKLYIVGDGPHRAALEGYAAKNQMQNVQFLGNQGGGRLLELVQNSKFVVVPSEWYDNSPLVIYESFSMGKPVICSDLGGMPELVNDGENGFVFRAGDQAQLRERIRRLWDAPALCRALGEKAREKAEDEFSPGVHYERIMAEYDRLLGRGRKTSPATLPKSENVSAQ